MTQFDFYKARRIGETINATFTFIRQEFIPMGRSVLFIVGPLMLISAMISNATFSEQISVTPESLLSIEYWGNASILMFLQLTIYTLLILVINHYILLYVNGDQSRFSVQVIFNNSVKEFWKLFGITILFSIIVGIGFMILIVPGLYLSVSLSLLYAIILQEKITLGNAFNRSAFLIREYWWFSFGLLILIWIVVYMLQLVFQAPLLIISLFSGFHEADPSILNNYSWWVSISTILSQISNLFYGIFVVGTTVHYYSQREKKEAAGLLQKISALDDDPDSE